MKTRNEWNDTLAKKLILPVTMAWVTLAIVFGFQDLQISKTFVNPNSLWGNFGAYFGEAPGLGLIAAATAILFGSQSDELRLQRIPGYVVMGLGIALMAVGIISGSEGVAIIGGAIAVSMILASIATLDRDWRDYKTFAKIIVLLAIIVPLLFVHVTKMSFGRVRFSDLNQNYSNYTPWFEPHGFTGHRSFPSGHAAMGWMLLPLLLLVKDREGRDLKRIVITALVIGWGTFIAASRVVVGAHYASDVLFSTGASSITMILLYRFSFFRRYSS